MTSTDTMIRHETLDNGLVGAVERIEGVRSVGARIFVPAGVIHEPIAMRGASPVCAELLLRGSRTRPSRHQADLFDLAGASRETSARRRALSIGARVLDANLEQTLELLADMLLNPAMEDDSFESARRLALGSLASLDDDPQERAVLAARRRHLPDPDGRSEHGTREGLEALTPGTLRDWWDDHRTPRGAVVALSGAVDPGLGLEMIRAAFGSWEGAGVEPERGPRPERGYAHEPDDANQCQIVLVHDAPEAGHDDETLEMLVSAILSGGMSGRLFTEVREKRGLCYAVSSSYRPARGYGVVTAYVGTTPERAQESLDVLCAELERINTGGVGADELERARIGLKSRLIFSGESTSARSGAIAGDIDSRGAPRTLAGITERIDAVTLDELNAYLARRTLGETTIQTLGPDPLTPPR